MAGETGQGIFGGAVTGASAGAPLGPWGMGVGAVLGGASGLVQGREAKRLNQMYQDAEKAVQTTDPGQMAFLNRLRQQERNLRAGTDASSAFAARNAGNVASTTQSNLMRAGGPGLVGNLLRSQSAVGNTMAQIGANASQQANQVLGLQGGIVDQIANRNLMRQRELRNQAMERSVSARQNIQNMFSGALAMIPQVTAQFPQGQGAQNYTGRMFDPTQPTRMEPRMGGAPLPYQPIG